MTLPANSRLALSLWPFALLAPPEIFGVSSLVVREGTDVAFLWALSVGVLAVGASFLLAAALLPVIRRGLRSVGAPWWHSTASVVVIYSALGMLQAVAILVISDTLASHGGLPPFLAVIYVLARPVNLVILAIVVEQLRDGVSTMRTVNGEVAERIALTRRTNGLLEQAETSMREESRTALIEQVGHPLRTLVREAPGQSDDEVADELDNFIAERLRPLSHVLHPVSVRLGIVSAVQSLNPDVTMDVPPAVERMDRDGVLLDDGVRLQVYRWIREHLRAGTPTRVALVLRGRELEVSVHPSAPASLDAVQVVAGLREMGRGALRAPLRGQVPAASVIAGEQTAQEPPVLVRQRARDILTVPLPRRIGLVALIGLGSLPYQLVAFRWDLDWRSVLAALTLSAVAIVVSAVFTLLPRVRSTRTGAAVVVLEWIATGLIPAFAFGAAATALGLYASVGDNIGLDVFRSTYRFTIVGLILVVAHGVVVQSRRALELATGELEAEERRRGEILAQSRRLDTDVAEALHRTVQGRLAAAVVLIRLGRRDEAWNVVEDMAGVEIPRLLERMQVRSGVIPAVPSGLNVELISPDPLPEELVPDVRSALGEIAVNAQRHGGASRMTVRVTRQQGLWTIDCLDDGSGPARETTPGLGSRLLDELTFRHGGDWSFAPADSGCRVVLQIPDPATAPVPSPANA